MPLLPKKAAYKPWSTKKSKSGLTVLKNTYGDDWDARSLSVRKQDNFTCQKCKRHKSELKLNEKLQVHHLQHRADGGSNSRLNLVTLCSTCHKKQHKHMR